jgi:hypothetical protein
MEVKLHEFLTSAIYGGEWLASCRFSSIKLALNDNSGHVAPDRSKTEIMVSNPA